EVRFSETPKPTRETRALPGRELKIVSARPRKPTQLTGESTESVTSFRSWDGSQRPAFLRGAHALSHATPVRLGLAAPRRNALEREQSTGKMPVGPTGPSRTGVGWLCYKAMEKPSYFWKSLAVGQSEPRKRML